MPAKIVMDLWSTNTGLGEWVKEIQPSQEYAQEIFKACLDALAELGTAAKLVEVIHVRFFQPAGAETLWPKLKIVLFEMRDPSSKFNAEAELDSATFTHEAQMSRSNWISSKIREAIDEHTKWRASSASLTRWAIGLAPTA